MSSTNLRTCGGSINQGVSACSPYPVARVGQGSSKSEGQVQRRQIGPVRKTGHRWKRLRTHQWQY